VTQLTVAETAPGTYTVTTGTTTHTVLVPDGLPGRLGWGDLPVPELVRRSFEFLLAREPATSILRRFSLEQIGDYFPEYPAEIRRAPGDTGRGGGGSP